MAIRSDMCGFPQSGKPVLSGLDDGITLNTGYDYLRSNGFLVDTVGNTRMLGNMQIQGTLTGVTSLTMNGNLSGVGTISSNNNQTNTGVNSVFSMTGANASIGTNLQRIRRGFFTDLEIKNTPTVDGEPVALIKDLRQAVGSVDLSGYVPYTGATTNVDLGANSLTAENLNITGNPEYTSSLPAPTTIIGAVSDDYYYAYLGDYTPDDTRQHKVRVYPYEIVGGVKLVSPNYIESSVVEGSSYFEGYSVDWSWDSVAGADGYYIVLWDNQTRNWDYYIVAGEVSYYYTYPYYTYVTSPATYVKDYGSNQIAGTIESLLPATNIINLTGGGLNINTPHLKVTNTLFTHKSNVDMGDIVGGNKKGFYFDAEGTYSGDNRAHFYYIDSQGFGEFYIDAFTYGDPIAGTQVRPSIQWMGADTGQFTGEHRFRTSFPTQNGALRDVLTVGYKNFGSLFQVGIYNSAVLNLYSNTTTRTSYIESATGRAYFALGSASFPSHSFINDTNTGMFSPTADTIAFSTNSVERARISNSGLEIKTSLALPYTAQTATYAITTTDYLIDCTANTFTATLPTAVGITGRQYVIKNSGTGTITVATTSSQTIDGQLTQTLSQYDAITVQSTNAGWIII
jgi:hypothetical protein